MTILNNILAVSVREFRVMCTRYSILMVLSGGIFLYGLLYNYMYAPNVVRNAPVAVVDMSQTPLSRHYSRLLDATPQAQVLTNNADLQAAKKLMKQREVVGIVYIPEDFDGRVGRGEEAVYVMYSTTTAFLYYASMQEASAGISLPPGNCWFSYGYWLMISNSFVSACQFTSKSWPFSSPDWNFTIRTLPAIW